MSEELQKLYELIEAHERRLHKRELQKARFGNNIDSDESGILEDIESIKQNLRELYKQVKVNAIHQVKTTEFRFTRANEDMRKFTLRYAAFKRRYTISFKRKA